MTAERGAPDPARSLALLWRGTTSTPRGRGPRPGLSVDQIVRAAVEVADAEGLAALNMRRVAQRLGVGTMSLYTYVPGKAELLEAMVDAVYADLYREAAEPEAGWRVRLEGAARENWAMFQRHPWMLQVRRLRTVLGPGAMAKYEHELRAVEGIGLTDLEVDALLALLLGHVEATARAGLERAETEQATGLTDRQWWEAQAPLLEATVDVAAFPAAARVGSAVGAAHGSAYPAEHNFKFGLGLILDCVEQLVRSRKVRA